MKAPSRAGLPALLAVAVVLAGCMASDPGGVCSEDEKVPVRSTYEQNGLFAAFPAPGTMGDWTVTAFEPEGHPLQDRTRGEVLVTSIQWYPWPDLPGTPGAILFTAPHQVTGIYADLLEPQRIRDAFLEFTANLTGQDEAKRAGWADVFMTERTEFQRLWSEEHGREVVFHQYAIDISGPYRVQDHYYAALRQAGRFADPPDPYKGDYVRLGDTWFLFPPPERTATHGDGRTLKVDARDLAVYAWRPPAGTTEGEHLARLEAAVQALGLPAPEPADVRFVLGCP